jgi:hypothetical protein
MKGVLTHIPSVQSHAEVTYDVSPDMLHIDTLWIKFERRFKDFERENFTESFIANPFQEIDLIERAELISPLLKENMSELELEIINLQTDLWLKTRVNNAHFRNLVPSAQYAYPVSECVSWRWMRVWVLLKWIGNFNDENTTVQVQIIFIW